MRMAEDGDIEVYIQNFTALPLEMLYISCKFYWGNSDIGTAYKSGVKTREVSPITEVQIEILSLWKIGHIDTTCWQKHFELKTSKKGASIDENAHFAFFMASYIPS